MVVVFATQIASRHALSKMEGDVVVFDRSPPSIVILSLSAPLSWRKVVAGVRTRVAVKRTSLESMKRTTDSAEVLPCTLRPLMATSSTWSKISPVR